jgi:hypothetical protein
MAVKRKVTVRMFHAQVRRIDCDHCDQPYSFVEGGNTSGEAEGSVLLSNSEELGRTAFRRLATTLEKQANTENRGMGRCPHCHQLQDWMVKQDRAGNLGCFGVLGLVLGVGAWILMAWLSDGATWSVILGVLATLLCTAAGLGGGWALAEKPGAKPDEKDPRVKTDEELLAWMQECLERNNDPALHWWLELGNDPHEKAMPFSLGVLDLAKNKSGVPEPLSTAGRIKVLDEMD